MFDFRRSALHRIATIAPRYLPFADVATPDVPLSRLLRLALFQVTVGMALVLLVGTLNRVMIVELAVPASLVSAMLALPLVFAPFRALIGHRSDNHVSALGWRRVPYVWKGTMLQFGGFAVMPFALLVLSGYGEAQDAPLWLGHGAAAISFLLVGAGLHTVQTAGLALATDLVRPEDQPKVVGLMYVMLLAGMMVSALVFGALLADYTPGRLIQVIQGAAVVTILLNLVAIWKQEPRDRDRALRAATQQDFSAAWRSFAQEAGALRLLAVIALGTAGFGMADVLLEPFGGQALGMSVGQTTQLTAAMALGGLLGFGAASRTLGQGATPQRVAAAGAATGIPAFALVILSSFAQAHLAFVVATILIGFGAGLFGHGTLTATMRNAPRERIGLALGAWGAVQATAAGCAIAIAGVVRDLNATDPGRVGHEAAAPYIPVFAAEIVLLVLALILLAPSLLRAMGRLDHGRAGTISRPDEVVGSPAGNARANINPTNRPQGGPKQLEAP
jgi:BCD family chlorophyll transporter-like MFS transporter